MASSRLHVICAIVKDIKQRRGGLLVLVLVFNQPLRGFDAEIARNESIKRQPNLAAVQSARTRGNPSSAWVDNELVSLWASERNVHFVICRQKVPWCVVTPACITTRVYVNYNGHHCDSLHVPHAGSLPLRHAL
eukprot:2946655-Amphidinium_carterae.1